MKQKFRKIISTVAYFTVFLCINFLYLSINKIYAAGLEVQYPVISGQSIDAGTTLPYYIKYLFNAGMFIGYFSVFISLIIAGILYFLSPVKAEFLSDAKDRISGAISGLLILTLTYLIITTINPQLSILHLNELPPTPPPPASEKSPGVYLYNQSDCFNDRVQPNTSNITDLGNLKNKINSVGIVQNPDNETYYIPILYDNTNLWGQCQYINPNQSCQPVEPFAASVSIYKYDFNPNGDGVYFYRRSYFDEKGGYYIVDNSEIQGIYIQKLENLKFRGVPQNEQDCIQYDQDGKCHKNSRRPPSLAGDNISSIKINGNYLVLLVYFGPTDNPNGPWTSCQEFPTTADANKLGPQQLKWQNIRNSGTETSGGVIPNYVIIIPIQR